jgi:hypothetical protein
MHKVIMVYVAIAAIVAWFVIVGSIGVYLTEAAVKAIKESFDA